MYPILPGGADRSDPQGKVTQPRSWIGLDTLYTEYTPMSHDLLTPSSQYESTHVPAIHLRSLSFPILSRLVRGGETDKDTKDEEG